MNATPRDEDDEPDLTQKFVQGILLFNEEDFFECHEVLEDVWTETEGEERRFIQGLIQASVALFHFGNENLGGARKLYDSARRNLEPYGSPYLGIDVARFLTEFEFCFQELLDAGNVYPTGVELRDERVPRLHFVDE